MANIKITGHASGTGVVTVTAPNTSTNRTITLPDTTGTLLDENSSVPAANLTGTVADARFPSTLPAASGANLTALSAGNLTGTVADARISALTASKLTGALPAISGANLTGLVSDINGLTDATVSTSDPATDSDPSAVGHLWINKTSGEVYVCTDITAGSNVWVNIGEGDGGVVPPVWYGARGVFGGGGGGGNNVIDYITIATTGNAIDFGDLTVGRQQLAACSNGARGVFGGGTGVSDYNTIDYITIATAGNAVDFGDLNAATIDLAACSNGVRGVFGGGTDSSMSTFNTMDYITIATTGNATDFGDLTVGRYGLAACSNSTRGLFAGGGGGQRDIIDYITIATTGNATDFGDLTADGGPGGRSSPAACSNDTRGVWAGGETFMGTVNTMDYVTIATTGNATDFGDLSVTRYDAAGTSNNTRGVFGGGSASGDTIDYITIATTGNATDFGDLTVSKSATSACSGS